MFRMPFTDVLKGSEKRISLLCQKLQKGWGEDTKGSDLFSGLSSLVIQKVAAFQ